MSKQRIWWIVGIVGLGTAVVLLPVGWLQQVLAFLLLWLVPIPVVVSVLERLKPQLQLQSPPTSAEEGERWLIAAGLVLLIHPLLALLIHYVPGSTPTWLLLLIAIVFSLLAPRPSPLAPRPSPLYLLPLLLALLLRLPNMGYKEIQGDEGVILVRAAAALTGDDAELFLHQKGPMEILLPLVTWGVTGEMNEFWARLPFFWAGVLGVAAVMLLARRWFNGRIALIAGFLMAIMGFGVAFSRIIQYQTLVMLWGMLALLCASRYGAERQRGDLVLTAVFLAAGLLAHYDAVLVVPAVGWALLRPKIRDWRLGRFAYGDWVVAGGVGFMVLGLFYVPFALNPNFERTVGYLLNDRVGAGDGVAGWSGTAVWQMMTFYNSTYYIVGLIVLLLVGLWALWRKREGGTAVLYFLVPALFYIFIVTDPRTHVYTIFPGAIILAAVGIDQLTTQYAIRNTKYAIRFTVYTLTLIWFLASANYVYLLFVDVTPERQRNWVEERPSLYLTTWTEPPLYGLFGFPHQAGWREVAELLDNNVIYASNEEREITNWYMRQAPRTHCANFDKFIWVANAQDEIPYEEAWLQHLEAEVVVNGDVALRVYGREAVGEVERVDVKGNGRSSYYTPAQIAPSSYGGTNPVGVTFGEQVRLLGYDLDASQAQPGGQIWLTLYWQPLVPFERNYQVFVHLYNGQMRGQDDGAPECDLNPTTRWEPGQIIADPHRIPIAADAPTASIPLLVGMYGLLDQQRLSVPNSLDNVLYLTDVLVGE